MHAVKINDVNAKVNIIDFGVMVHRLHDLHTFISDSYFSNLYNQTNQMMKSIITALSSYDIVLKILLLVLCYHPITNKDTTLPVRDYPSVCNFM